MERNDIENIKSNHSEQRSYRRAKRSGRGGAHGGAPALHPSPLMTVATIEEWESKVLIQSGSSFLLRNHMNTSTISSLNKEIQLYARS